MLNLVEVKARTASIFEKDIVVPEPSIHWKDKLAALEEANLTSQRNACLFDMRCEQATKMGFVRHTSHEYVEMLMGEASTEDAVREDVERQNHEWFYNHHTGQTLNGSACNWGGKPTDFVRMEKTTRWYLSPFSKKEAWRCRFGKLDYLKRDIPYGVVLRINELKKYNLFNVFGVFAPIEAWERKTDIDPIVVAAIWEITEKNAGQTAFFFVAQW